MPPYPFSSTGTLILDHNLYQLYGGWTGTSSSLFQRELAYNIAERQVTDHIGTYLLPQWVTGVYNLSPYGNVPSLEHTYINALASVRIIDAEGKSVYSTGSTTSLFLQDREYGYLSPTGFAVLMGSQCGITGLVNPLQAEIVYNAGLSSGVASEPLFTLALVMAAGLNLKEIVEPGALEGGAGDAGVMIFISQAYHEHRTPLGNTVFGNSAIANKIRKLLLPYVKRKGLKL
jgi:hypothetical protein